MTTQYKRRVVYLILTGIILLAPFIAMQFTPEVNWSTIDFIVAGSLLIGAGLIVELIIRKVRSKENRNFLIIGIIVLLLLVWIELAVGIFGTPLAGS